MCTVTYIPKGEAQYILTHNRDEMPERSPQQVTRDQIEEHRLIFPREPSKGGTWIASSDQDLTICILNGAFVSHERTPPYRRSRGLVALDFFSYSKASAFVDRYRFEGIEPFTMLICEGPQLHELRWDGKKAHLNELDTQKPHIWSSAPLYKPEVHRKREQWFDVWRQLHPQPELEEILDFHHNAGEGDPRTDVIMKRSEHFRTVSVTNVIRSEKKIDMKYNDLITSTFDDQSIELTSVSQPSE